MDDKQAADYLSEIAKGREGILDIVLPDNIAGRSVLPDGTVVDVDKAIVVMKSDGSIKNSLSI